MMDMWLFSESKLRTKFDTIVFAVAEFVVRIAAVIVRYSVFRVKADDFAVILHRAPVVAETVVRYGPVEVGVGVFRVDP